MTPRLRRIVIGVLWTGLVAGWSADAEAQAPAYITQWGSHGSGDGQFFNPVGIAIDAAGDVYVADTNNNRIQKFSPAGVFLLQWKGHADAQFHNPFGLAIGANGTVYVAFLSDQIQYFSSTGAFLGEWTVSGGGYLEGIAVDAAGEVYVVDSSNDRILKYTSSGTLLTQWGSHGQGNSKFDGPIGVTLDAAGDVYVADSQNHRIQKFTATGNWITKWGSLGAGDGQFNVPVDVAADASGNVYVTDSSNNRVEKFTATGTYLTQWGTAGTGDGQFNVPWGVAADGTGNVYVSDYSNDRIEKFGTGTVDVPTSTHGQSLALQSIRPNPFPRSTLVSFSLEGDAEVSLTVYDLSGREVTRLLNQERMAAGPHEVRFDGRGLPNGLYFCTMRAGAQVATRRMIVMR